MKWTAALLALAVTACSAPQFIEGSGRPAKPPRGWEQFCRDNPKDPSCVVRPV